MPQLLNVFCDLVKCLRILEDTVHSNNKTRLQTRQCNNARGQTPRPLSFRVESLNQRVTGGDNCVWAINTIREDKSLFICPSSFRQKAIISQLPRNHREHIFHRQLGRRGKKKREDKVELELEARAADLLPATMLSLAAFIWPQQSRPGRKKPRVMLSHSNASLDHSSHLTSEAHFVLEP